MNNFETNKITVLYHNDADGFCSAFAYWLKFRNNATYIPVQYNQPVPEIPKETKKLKIVDFSYNRETCISLAERFGHDNIIIIDHHKTAEAELKDLDFVIFNNSKSGAVLTWEYIFPYEKAPAIFQYVQDRDLWKFKLPYSKEVNSYIATFPFDFNIWLTFNLQEAMDAGKGIIAFQKQQIERAIKNVSVEKFYGYLVPIVNLSDNISEIGNELCIRHPLSKFSVSYCDRNNNQRTYSLRSIGDFDVSEITKHFGGGGHKNAAGFSIEKPEVFKYKESVT